MSNIKISGSGSFNSDGSVYESVHISGAGKINGAIRCRSFHVSGAATADGDVFCEGEIHCSGSCKINGSAECKSIRISGACEISDSLKAQETHCSGATKINGDADCGKASFSGASKIKGNVTFTEINMSGKTKILGNASGDYAKISGISKVEGLLNAEIIEIRLPSTVNGGDCIEIKEIGCTRITVDVNDGGSEFKIFGLSVGRVGRLSCEIIEGDDVSLRNTTAKKVSGKNVVIGDGCKIERVEYTDSISISDDSTVTELIKI